MEHVEAYNQYNAISYYFNEEIAKKYFDLLTWKANETVTDIGMGDGKFTVKGLLPRLPKDLKSLIGSDIEPTKVEFAKKTYPYQKVNFEELDIASRDLPLALYGKFDHVFAFYILHWVCDPRQAVENIFAMLKPGAETFVTIIEQGADASFYNLSQNPKWAPYGHEKYISKYLHVEDRLPIWRNMFLDAGFRGLNCFREKMSYRNESRETCEGFFKSFNPITPYIPKEEQEEYLNDYIAELSKTTGYIRREICPKTSEEIWLTQPVVLTIYAKKPDIT